MITTNTVIPGRNTKKGIVEGTKGSLNKSAANSWLLIKDSKIPIRLPNIPK